MNVVNHRDIVPPLIVKYFYIKPLNEQQNIFPLSQYFLLKVNHERLHIGILHITLNVCLIVLKHKRCNTDHFLDLGLFTGDTGFRKLNARPCNLRILKLSMNL